ncbi:histidine kinase dimerization/phosphoacceptor domain -containing protein [Parvularcula dongshanensis]|uniref:histidine kinase n=1 Tax=Parvularcula dongshanensis TaxID=1173995 RepID=A0A840I547_9PROT|nr:two-component sensor histidine kinase [Parvularcula dongshanensis]
MPDSLPFVLYIDDDPGLASLAGRALQRRGFGFAHAESGADGLARLGAGGVDVVALDHFMPDETGLDVLPKIRSLPDAPPVVYVTGSDDSRVAVAALKAGAADYVWKDVNGEYRELLAESILAVFEQERLRRAKVAAEAEVRVARDRAEALLVEVNHRVANSLQLVSSLILLQERALPEDALVARAALGETVARIEAISRVHRHLYTSEDVTRIDLDVYLRELIEQLQDTSCPEGGVTLSYAAVSELYVSANEAVSLGVILTELVTNAIKYAYPSGTGGVRINLSRERDEIALTVADDGVGSASEAEGGAKGTGLGTKIIGAMAGSLKGRIVHNPVAGTSVTVRFRHAG